jgi:microcystin-dependent protein
MSVANMPSHDHQSQVSSDAATTDVPGVQANSGEAIYISAAEAGTLKPTGGTTRATGGDQSISVLNPYLGLNYIIALTGLYPSRS